MRFLFTCHDILHVLPHHTISLKSSLITELSSGLRAPLATVVSRSTSRVRSHFLFSPKSLNCASHFPPVSLICLAHSHSFQVCQGKKKAVQHSKQMLLLLSIRWVGSVFLCFFSYFALLLVCEPRWFINCVHLVGFFLIRTLNYQSNRHKLRSILMGRFPTKNKDQKESCKPFLLISSNLSVYCFAFFAFIMFHSGSSFCDLLNTWFSFLFHFSSTKFAHISIHFVRKHPFIFTLGSCMKKSTSKMDAGFFLWKHCSTSYLLSF